MSSRPCKRKRDEKSVDIFNDDDKYFMEFARLASTRSQDPSTKVGACIVDENKRILGIGCNNMPNGCDGYSWEKDVTDPLKNKYLYVAHAELNAVVNAGTTDIKNSTIYVTLFPCNECAKLLIQKQIKEVVYKEDRDEVIFKAARRMLTDAKIILRQISD